LKLTIGFDASRHTVLFGRSDKNLKHLRHRLRVDISARNGNIVVSSEDDQRAKLAQQVLQALVKRLGKSGRVTTEDMDAVIDEALGRESPLRLAHFRGAVVPFTESQAAYISAMLSHDLTLCFGPAGTGKTYLAVAVAVSMLKSGAADRIVLVRPAVEAGEKLGFLPGGISDKLDPYMRPLYDALSDMMKPDMLAKLTEDGRIEIAPLAFMRGRTFRNAAVILDEAQNATTAQMLMFLTRMGKRCKMVVTGDASQSDIDHRGVGGMADAAARLAGIEGVAIAELAKSDIVRHPLVERIVEAYGRRQTPTQPI